MIRDRRGRTPVAMRIRRLWPDHNPLRRASDRIEFFIVASLLVAFLVAAPLTTAIAVTWATVAGRRADHADPRQVPAVLLADAPASAGSVQFPTPPPRVPARWVGPTGPRIGLVNAQPGERAGTTVLIWVDRWGRATGEPVGAASMLALDVAAPMIALSALSLAAATTVAGAEILLNRRRMAAWDADWSRTEPQWTGRY